MKDLAIHLDDRPGALAEMGEALGRAGVSIEGGGVFVSGGAGVAHFLFTDGTAAQLGKLARRMADKGVNIRVQYSDHEHQLVLVVDDLVRAREVSEEWMRGR